jgi:hypothetical protein
MLDSIGSNARLEAQQALSLQACKGGPGSNGGCDDESECVHAWGNAFETEWND